MKNRIAVCFFAVLIFTGITFSAFAQQEDLRNIQNGVKEFSGDISKAIPFNSLIGLNWSDAYIGKLFPGAPPHFGVGISLGVTTMDIKSIEKLAGYFVDDFSLGMPKMPIPAYTAEARLGGFFLPFDIGFKFGYLPPINLPLGDINLDYLLVGGDVRYAIIDGVANKALPNVSLGVGVNYLRGGIGAKMGDAQSIPYNYGTVHYIIDLSKPEVNLQWNTTSLEVKAQISKTFAIITPYLGVGGNYSFSNAGYSVNADVKLNGRPVTDQDIETINDSLVSNGLDPIDIKADGISSFIDKNAFNVRAFGGFSLNLAAFRLDITGLFNILDQNFGGTLGLRFQL
jgi:hypothetical protein